MRVAPPRDRSGAPPSVSYFALRTAENSPPRAALDHVPHLRLGAGRAVWATVHVVGVKVGVDPGQPRQQVLVHLRKEPDVLDAIPFHAVPGPLPRPVIAANLGPVHFQPQVKGVLILLS